MKKSIALMALSVLLGTGAFASDTYLVTDVNMDNFWVKTGKTQEKIYTVAAKLMEGSKLDKRVPLEVTLKPNTVNANSNTFYKNITVYSGILYCADSDDELAFIIGHEMAHSIEAYGGPLKLMAMNLNSKNYEYKSDLKAIDYMVNAGFDPIAAITMGNKIFSEPMWDWGFISTHPKGSKRLIAIYKYIYKKYPQYLASPKTNNPYYKNFIYAYEDELRGFRHKEDVRKQKQLKRQGEAI